MSWVMTGVEEITPQLSTTLAAVTATVGPVTEADTTRKFCRPAKLPVVGIVPSI